MQLYKQEPIAHVVYAHKQKQEVADKQIMFSDKTSDTDIRICSIMYCVSRQRACNENM